MPLFHCSSLYNSQDMETTQVPSKEEWIKRCTISTLYICTYMKVKVLVTQLCPTIFDPIDCSPPGSSVHGILQARILQWVAIPFSRGSFQSKDWTPVSFIACRFFTIWDTREASVCVCVCVCVCACVHVKLLQSCPTLCNPMDPMDCSPPGSSVHGNLQTRILEWIAMPSSKGSSQPRHRTCLLWLLHCRWIFYLWATGEAPYIYISYIYIYIYI